MNLQQLRISKGYISQRTFAKQLGVIPSTLCMWEKGKSAPKLNMMKKLATIFEVSLEEIANAIENSKKN